MSKIFIVEDEQKMTELLAKALTKAGFTSNSALDFQNIATEINDFAPDLILMDLNLPKFSGYYLTKIIRQSKTTPIIFLSSQNDQLTQVQAMELGADDFVEKPFNLPILIAKINALLRRTMQFNSLGEILKFREYRLNLKKGIVSLKQDDINLSKTELQILHSFFAKPNQVLTKEELINQLWENESFIDQNTLMVNISRLRKKIAEIGLDHYLKTKKGVGYSLGEDHE